MKLLLDQNLSARLLDSLSGKFPGSTHVRLQRLDRCDDIAIWDYAKDHGYAIVSKDSDFHQRSLVAGHPPKVIYLKLGNAPTAEVLKSILGHTELIERFFNDEEESILVILS